MALLKDWFGWEGPYTANQRRTEEQHTANMEKIQALLQTENGRRLVLESQKLMNESRAGYYDRAGDKPKLSKFDSMAKWTKDRKTLDDWRDEKIGDNDELSPSDQKMLNAALEELYPEQTKQAQAHGPEVSRQYFDQQNKPSPEMQTSKSAAEYFTPDDSFIGPKQAPAWPDLNIGGPVRVESESPAEYLAPKTYEQMGIENVADMATLQEMQEALPEVDIKGEYEADPENMQRLLKFWRENKTKISKERFIELFRATKQKARESLGIN